MDSMEKKLSPLDEYWNTFLVKTGRDSGDICSGDMNFESKGFENDSQIALILSGRKTAIFSSFPSFSIDSEPLPVSGELYLILDRGENPRCVIELDSVTILPYNEITWEMAKQEGEDASLAEWREKEQEYLEDEGAIMGFSFTPDIKLVFQTFHVVYK